MRQSVILLKHASRITLFTRANCSLCDNAKLVLSRVWDHKPFEYKEVNVMDPGQKQWRDIYEFDTPVVHIQKDLPVPIDDIPKAQKLMHRFTEEEVERLIDMVTEDKGS